MANKDKISAGVDIISQVADRVRNSSNILIALSKDPNIDELTAALSLALIFEKFGKHATAIFSGQTPNIISFLQPEKTFESNTNSLQDFIIALDKEKADHIRYKIDGDFVKVFITPYKTTLNEKDLEYSHGDYNVDLVIALNVKSEEELDSALVEYGRIMHDASSINISPAAPGSFGDIEWGDPNASSVNEMVYRLVMKLQEPDSPLIDENVATSLLTGIISATNRFSNERTTADTLSVASNLLASGANQQLIAKNIPVDILTSQDSETAQEAKEESKPEEQPKSEEPKEEPKADTPEPEEKLTDPTNFSIAHQEKPQAKKEDKAPEEPKSQDFNIEEKAKNAEAETDRIIEEIQQKQADEQAKAEAEAKKREEEQKAAKEAEAKREQALKDEIVAKVSAEQSQAAPKTDSILPPTPPREFEVKKPEPIEVEAVKPVETEKPEVAPVETSEPTVIPNAIPANDDNVLPPPPAPFDTSAMPPAFPTNAPAANTETPTLEPTPAVTPIVEEQKTEEPLVQEPVKIPTANEIAANFQAKKAEEAKQEESAPVMPAVSMPSQENVNRALNAAQNTTAVSPVVAAAPINPSPAPAAPTLAPRPTTTPTSPVATPAAPAQSPAPTTPTSDPGAFRIPGM